MSKLKICVPLFCLLMFCHSIYASDTPNELDNNKSLAFKQWINNRLDKYEIWREKQTQKTDNEKFNQINNWGRSDLSNNLKSVDYSNNSKIKKITDYSSDTQTFSVLLNENQTELDAKKILLQHSSLLPKGKLSLKNAVVTTHNVDYSLNDQIHEKNLIIQQTQAQMNEFDRQAEYLIMADIGLPRSFIDERVFEQKMKLLTQAKKRISELNDLYNKKRNNQQHTPNYHAKKIVTYTISLHSNTLSERANKFRHLAINNSKKWNIESALIMAIMHTESAFRPNAKSGVPAYGLMQIVPATAGRDVNNYINNLDEPMKVNDLYRPDINIETGTAYLNILSSRYLNKITDPKSRLYCMISAYNTGAGNVARVFNADKSTNINKAFHIINQMSSKQVYQQLMNNLPYDETKHYLKNVYSRMKLYH